VKDMMELLFDELEKSQWMKKSASSYQFLMLVLT
jgi:hypothetical protein